MNDLEYWCRAREHWTVETRLDHKGRPICLECWQVLRGLDSVGRFPWEHLDLVYRENPEPHWSIAWWDEAMNRHREKKL